MTTNYPDVVQAMPGSETAQQQLLDAIECKHPSDAARRLAKQLTASAANHQESAASLTTLASAALCVPEDLCLLERSGNHYELVAGCVTAPSYWRLSDKLGKSLWGVHGDVPGLNDSLGERMQAFFERLPEERYLLRRNWFLHASSALYQPNPERRRAVRTIADAEKLSVRSETQTLRRLSEHVIVFTIAVECHPLREIEAYPEAALAMNSALESRNDNERRAASQASYSEGVHKFLDRCARE